MKYEKYLNESRNNKIEKQVKELIKLSKSFIADLKISKGKYNFQEIPGLISNIVGDHIDQLNKIFHEIGE